MNTPPASNSGTDAVADADVDTEVLIVGGGPVGMGLAIELGQRGVRCVVVERYPQPQPIPRGQNLTQRTMEHLHFWGAEKRLRAARTIPPEYGIGGLTAYGTLLGPHVHDWLQRDLVQPYYYTANERLPQYATEAVLRERAAELPSVQTLYGWDALSIVQDAQGVTATIRQRQGQAQRVVRAQYLVGCDGSRSRVREQAGLTQTRSDHDRLMVLLVFRSTQLHELLRRYPGKSYYNVLQPALQGYWKFFGRVDLGNTWFFHAPVPAGTTADNYDFRALLHEAVGTPFEVEFQHIGFWDLRFAVADAYRAGRIFIAGDAAHSHPPYGGYGVNSGLEDARNLGWKLAAVLQGWGGAALLDSYDAERRPVFKSTIDDFIARAIETDRDFLASFDPQRDAAAFDAAWQARTKGAVGEVQSFEPNYEGSPVVVWNGGGEPGPCSAKGSHRFEARPGHHLAPAALVSGANVFESFGPGFTLLAFDADDAEVQAFRAAAAGLGLPLAIVEGTAAGQTARYAAQLVLVRPDQFVAWSAREWQGALSQARHILQVACGAVAGPTGGPAGAGAAGAGAAGAQGTGALAAVAQAAPAP
jgi:2-polyprenyl-6-methoxyphenol hydroxylase-like FAD-dependent oxidoreductase